MKRATTLLLAVILATVFIPLPATAQPLMADPAVGRLTNRKAYEPGGEHFLFGHSRGTVHKRKGGIKIRPGGTTLSGNIETETVYFNGTYGYETKFHNHHWDEHSPFEERTLRAGKGKGASLSDGFGATNYVYGITATKVHPEDGYDGPQGGGYIKPKGARDIYSYSVIGTASRSRMTTPEKAPCIKGAACPASPFFDGLTPGSETHNDYMRSRKTLDAGEGSATDAAVRAAHADSADNADIGAIAEGIAKQRGFQEAYGTTRPYGFTAGQLAAFGKGQSSPMAELAAGGNGIYLKPEYINASINSRIPEPVRQKAGELANQAGDAWRHDKAVLDNTAGKIRNQLGSHLDGSWDNRKTFGANAADKLAGSAAIMKTGLDGLGETSAGKAVGKAVDEVTPDAVKRGIGNAADYGKRSLDSWAGNDLNRQSYANALWGAAAVVADSRLPGKGRGKGHGRHDHDGHARSHDGHNGGKDGGHAHDRADADGGSRAGTSHRHSHDEAGNGGGTAYGTSRPTFAGGSTGTHGSRPETHGGGSRREGSHGGHNGENSGSGQYADGSRLGHDTNGHAADGNHAGNEGRPSEKDLRKPPEESRAEPEVVADYQRRADALRNEFTHPNIREYGNVGIADIDIEGVDAKTMAAHSSIHKPNKGFIGDGQTKFEYLDLPPNKTIENQSPKPFPRNADAEYQLFSNIADRLGNNHQATGKVIIYTEKPVCISCSGVAQQFKSRYPNINVQIIDGNGMILTY